MGIWPSLSWVAMQGLRFSPLGELLSFASPKESNQRKGDPTSLPCGSPIWRARTGAPPTRPGTGHKTPRAAELGHGSAFSPSAHAKSAALKGNNPGYRPRVMPTLYLALAPAQKPLLCRRVAQPDGGEGRGVSEPARASSRAAPAGEQRREAAGRHSRGRLSLVTFFGEAKKVTRPKAKSEAAAITSERRTT